MGGTSAVGPKVALHFETRAAMSMPIFAIEAIARVRTREGAGRQQ